MTRLAYVEDIGDAVRTHCCSLVIDRQWWAGAWGRQHRHQPPVGGTLLFELEGPEVIVDPAQFPKTFKKLRNWQNSSKPVSCPRADWQDPLVLKPVHELGKYAMWPLGVHGPADFWNGLHSVSGPDHILFWDYRL